MKRSSLENFGPKMSNRDFAPYVLFFILSIGMVAAAFYWLVGPVLTTAIVFLAFLTTSIIVGVIERHVRREENEEEAG